MGKINVFKKVKLSPNIRGKRGVPVMFDTTVGYVVGFFTTKNGDSLYNIKFADTTLTLPEEYLIEVE